MSEVEMVDAPETTDIDFIRGIIEPELTDKEKVTWAIRRNLSAPLLDPAIDIFINGKMEVINVGEFRKKRQRNGGEIFVRDLLAKIRNPRYDDRMFFKLLDILKDKWALLASITDKKDPIPGTAYHLCSEIAQMAAYLRDAVSFKEKDDRNLEKDIEFLLLPGKANFYLRRSGINKVGDLTKRTIEDISTLEGIGPGYVWKMREALEHIGFEFLRSEESKKE